MHANHYGAAGYTKDKVLFAVLQMMCPVLHLSLLRIRWLFVLELRTCMQCFRQEVDMLNRMEHKTMRNNGRICSQFAYPK